MGLIYRKMAAPGRAAVKGKRSERSPNYFFRVRI